MLRAYLQLTTGHWYRICILALYVCVYVIHRSGDVREEYTYEADEDYLWRWLSAQRVGELQGEKEGMFQWEGVKSQCKEL